MKVNDRVYYLYTSANGTPIKLAAIVLAQASDGWLIRAGRYDIHSNDVKTFESVVSAAALKPRNVPWSFEQDLEKQA